MDKKSFTAFIMIALLVLLWMRTMQQPQPPPPQRPPAEQPPPSQPVPGDDDIELEPPEDPEAADDTPATLSRTGGTDALHTATWTNRGGAISRLELTQYKETVKGAKNLTLLQTPLERDLPPTLTLRDANGQIPLDAQQYEVEEAKEDGKDVLVYSSSFENGLTVVKTIETTPDEYVQKVTIAFKNQSDAPIQGFQYDMAAASRIVPRQDSAERDISAFYAVESRGKVSYSHSRAVSLDDEGVTKSVVDRADRLASAGIANRYFAVALMPKPEDGQTPWARDVFLRKIPSIDPVPNSDERSDNAIAWVRTRPVDLAPGQEAVHRYELYAGPKDPTILKQYAGLDGLINYGWFLFSPISRLLDSVLRFTHSITFNYGLAIILMTLLVKGCLHPLSKKSQISMHKMKQIQPFINELREKYKNDKERLAKEQMQLMREHGANPLTGCLPVFLQLPIFIGLFQMIRNAITLRHEGFLWIQDLSSPDTVAHIGGFPVNIMPVLMVVTWFLQQFTMPKPDDPQQRSTQKMMMFMPIVFGFMLYNYASGLALYWFTSTLVAIIEQKYIKWQIEKHHSSPVVVSAGKGKAGAPAPSAKAESKFSADRRPRKKGKGGAGKRK